MAQVAFVVLGHKIIMFTSDINVRTTVTVMITITGRIKVTVGIVIHSESKPLPGS